MKIFDDETNWLEFTKYYLPSHFTFYGRQLLIACFLFDFKKHWKNRDFSAFFLFALVCGFLKIIFLIRQKFSISLLVWDAWLNCQKKHHLFSPKIHSNQIKTINLQGGKNKNFEQHNFFWTFKKFVILKSSSSLFFL